MFERFTERARQVVVLAQEEARMLKHNYIGTEHILLGLLREEEGLAARVLESLGVTVQRAREQVTRIVGSGEEVTTGQIPFTPRAKKVLELSLREALGLGHNYIGTEHILLGLVRENEGVAARILLDFDANAKTIRDEVIGSLPGPGPDPGHEARLARQMIVSSWLGGLGGVLTGLAAEIQHELERAPDTGDLLLALACASDTFAAQALRELGMNLDELTGMIERLRAEALPAKKQLAQRIEEVRREKELAIETQTFERAAQMRDQERQLIQAHVDAVVAPEVLQEIRRRLGGIPRTDNPPPPEPS
jgi:ATP-dependent Clp protease ATP-binding subunit ClpA